MEKLNTVSTAIVTPFVNGKIDIISYENLLARQISSGIKSICVCGTTGEIATLDEIEYGYLIEHTVNFCGKNITVIAGIGGNNTKKVIENAKRAEQSGANFALAVTPYYNKPNAEGLYAHFTEVADKTNLPIILYNVPSRTNVDLPNATIVKLAKHDRIVGIKDATGILERLAILRGQLIASNVDMEKFYIICGDDSLCLGFLAMGGKGLISVASNVIPKECIDMYAFCLNQDYSAALNMQDRYIELFDSLFCDTNPAPVKYILSRIGIIKNELRLPLVSLMQDKYSYLDGVLYNLNII